MRLRPGDAAAHRDRGIAYTGLCDTRKALADLNTAIRLEPDDAKARLARGTVQMELGRHELAVLDFDEATRRRSADADAFAHRGRALEALGRFAEAAADDRRAVDLRPDDARLHNQLAWLLATCPAGDIRNGRKALQHATRACELTGWADATAIDTLAAAHAECGNFAAAVQHAERALALAAPPVAAEIDARLAGFRAHRPWRLERKDEDGRD